VIQSALKKAFAPEFLNRIDDVVLFNSLKRADIHEIIDIELKGLLSRVVELGYKISLSEEAKDFVADEGFDEAFGARPLARALQKLIEDPLAERIIGKQLNEGDEVIIELKDKELTFEIIKAKEEASEKAPEALPESTEDSTKDEA